MIKSKKALIPTTLITIILIILSFLALSYAVGKITGIIPSALSKEACHDSVLLRAATIAKTGILAKVGITDIPLKCKTEYRCLSMGGKCPEGYEKISVNNEDDIKKELANAMYDCWWMLGEGKANFMGRNLFKNEKVCVICSTLTFDEKVKEKIKTIEAFPDYLQTTKIPNKNMPYIEYFLGKQEILGEKSEAVINTANDYGIIFVLLEKNMIGWGSYAGAGCLMSLAIGVKVAAGTALVPVVGVFAAPYTGGITFVAGCAYALFGASQFDDVITGKEPYLASMHLIPYSSESINQIDCQKIESIP